jgi:Rrf2 family protein
MRALRITAKEDYALRAALELAIADGGPLTREQIAQAQGIPTAFLQNILIELRKAELVEAQRGRDGGFRLARPAASISVADVVRAVSGPLATVRGVRPQSVEDSPQASALRDVWVALRFNIRAILEHVSLAHLAAGKLPAPVGRIVAKPEAWE